MSLSEHPPTMATAWRERDEENSESRNMAEACREGERV